MKNTQTDRESRENIYGLPSDDRSNDCVFLMLGPTHVGNSISWILAAVEHACAKFDLIFATMSSVGYVVLYFFSLSLFVPSQVFQDLFQRSLLVICMEATIFFHGFSCSLVERKSSSSHRSLQVWHIPESISFPRIMGTMITLMPWPQSVAWGSQWKIQWNDL